MADKDNTPELELEPQGEAPPQGGTQPPPETAKATPEAHADDTDALAPRKDETVEQYAARVRSEVGWRDKQIGRQHRQKKEFEEKLARSAELEAENARLRELAQAGTKPKPQLAEESRQTAPQPQQKPQTGLPAEALAQARFQVGVERLSEQLNDMPEWKSASKNLEAAGGIPPEMVQAILDTDDPAHVMVALGSNMERYQQIMDMTEGRRRAALIKLGMETQKKEEPVPKQEARKPSGAPTPRGELPNVGAAVPEGDIDLYDDKYRGPEHDSAWYAKRQEQKRNSQGRPWSFGGRSGGGARG